MENHFDKRLDPTLLVDDAKSVVSLLLNYYPSEFQNADSYKISKLDDVKLPKDYEWENKWSLVKSVDTDPNGWEYNNSFNLALGSWHNSANLTDYVRRRTWKT